jgi:hypothetical protein
MFLQRTSAQSYFLPPSDQFRKDRLESVVIAESALFALTSIGLYYLWYKKFPKQKFRFFNDGREWMQIDKAGHAATAYNISSMQHDLLRWCGVDKNSAILSSALTSIAYLSIIEIMDGYSKNWGFSNYDMLANISGAGLFAAQQYGWGEQRINMKVSARFTPYAKENKQLLGNNWASRLMKDYNGQTYWLSFNLRSFLPVNSNIPSWANIAVGYGAGGMTRARETNIHNNNTKRFRRFFLAPDADLYRIHADNWTMGSLYLTRFIKPPTPAIEFNSKRKFKLHPIHF